MRKKNNLTIKNIFDRQKPQLNGFEKNWDLKTRQRLLKKLEKSIRSHEEKLLEAVEKDLGRNTIQTYAAEIHPIYQEIKFTQKNLSSWMQAKSQPIPWLLRPSKAQSQYKPKGRILIVGPFNYPVSLLILPLIAAIASGNRVLLKPSERTQETSAILANVIEQAFQEDEVSLVEGGLEVMQELLALPFDHFFFTGSEKVGRIVYEKAAKHLATVTLELGGKSPVIIWPKASIKNAARKIVWGKFLNAGQTCVAPDYLLCHSSLRQDLVLKIIYEIKKQLAGTKPCCSEYYSKSISAENQKRWSNSLKGVKIIYGGEICQKCNKLGPTIVTDIPQIHPLNEEIFGPILPLYFMSELEEVYKKISQHPYPLATYVFSDNKKLNTKLKEEWQTGALLNNEVMIHAGINLPFGGVKTSGIGRYRGYSGFKELSNIMTNIESSSLDFSQRYSPYRFNLEKTKKLLRWFF